MIIKLKNGTEFQFIDKITMGVVYAIAPLLEKGIDKLSPMEQMKLFEVFLNAALVQPIDFKKMPLDDCLELKDHPDFQKLLGSIKLG